MDSSQKRALANHRRRLRDRGLARYEVRGLESDKKLVRQFAQHLTKNDAEAERLRSRVAHEMRSGPEWPRTGADILDALRKSPLVGLGLDLEREVVPERDVDL
jgi:hypothetical protein